MAGCGAAHADDAPSRGRLAKGALEVWRADCAKHAELSYGTSPAARQEAARQWAVYYERARPTIW